LFRISIFEFRICQKTNNSIYYSVLSNFSWLRLRRAMYLKELKQLRGFDDEISKDIMCLTNMPVMC